MRIFKKIILRFFLTILLLVIFSPVIIFFIFQIPKVQTFLSSKITTILSETLNTDVQISRVTYNAPYDIVINDLFIADYNKDTLIYIDRILARPIIYNFKNSMIKIDRIMIEGLKAKYLIDSTGYSNFDYFIDNMTTTEVDTTAKPTNILINKIIVDKSAVLYTTQEPPVEGMIFDIDTFDLQHIRLKITNFLMQDEDISFNIEKTSFIDKSGLTLRNLNAKFFFNDKNMSLDNFYIRLNRTRLFFDTFSFEYKNVEEFAENIGEVFCDISLKKQTSIYFEDLGHLSKNFENFDEKVYLGLQVIGPINNLNINDLFIKYKQNTLVKSNLQISGLPIEENLYFKVEAIPIEIDISEIKNLTNPFDNNKKLLELPDDISLPNQARFEGNVEGNVEDMDIKGLLSTSIGDLYADFKFTDKNEFIGIDGVFKLNNFDLGYLMKDTLFGKITLKDSINFKFKDEKNFNGENNCYINSCYFNGYNYHSILFDAVFTNKNLVSTIFIRDTNLYASFRCDIDLNGAETKTNFKLRVDTAKLYKLKVIEDDPYAAISLGIEGNLKGDNMDNIEGEIFFTKSLILIMNLQLMKIKKFKINIKNQQKIGDNIQREVNINSDFLNGQAKGTFSIEDLGNFFSNIANYYFPALEQDSIVNIFDKSLNVSNNLLYEFSISNLEPIAAMFFPTVHISNNTSLKGIIDTENKLFTTTIKSDSINVSSSKLINFNAEIVGDTNSLNLNLKCDSIVASELKFENFIFATQSKKNDTSLKIKWKNNSTKINKGQIRSEIKISSDTLGNLSILIKVPIDTIIINSVLWTMKSDNIIIDSTGIDIKKISISTSFLGQNIGIRGKISHSLEDTLNLYINKFDISQLNQLLPDVKLKGYLMSSATFTNILDTPHFVMTNNIDNFAFNDVDLGSIVQTLKWKGEENEIFNDLAIEKKGKVYKEINGEQKEFDTIFRSISIIGSYYLDKENFLIDIIIDKLQFKPFDPYLKDYIVFSRNSNINGKFKISGDKLRYDIRGFLTVFGSFLVPQTGVNYTINGGMPIYFDKNRISIEKTTFVGPNLTGDATIHGTITHSNFENPYIKLSVNADTILFLNLPRTNESEYYGKVVASGNIDISGIPENLLVSADITAESNTHITYLLNKSSEVSNKTSIVTFITDLDTTYYPDEEEEKLSNLNIDINLKLNPEAKFNVVFDELTGEALEIQGEGKIKVKQSGLGDLAVIGKIAIERGYYNFVLENIVTRKFVISKGSSLIFNGDPMEGVIDIGTIYSIKNVNLYYLMMDDNYSGQKTQADCKISMTGQILAPEIRFSVDLPKADRRIASQVNNLDEANINKQFLSLLIFGRFQPLPGLTYDPTTTVATNFNAGELVSNQLNSLMSNINSDIDLDLNYVSGNEGTTDQFDVAVSVPLLNERISVTTDLGVGGNSQTAVTEQNNFIGDFEVDIKLNKKGNIQLKTYNKTNRNEYYDKGPFTQGIGLIYKTEFDHIFKPKNKKRNPKKIDN